MKKIVLLFTILTSFNYLVLNAQTFTWTGSTDVNWSDQTNWSTSDGSDGDDGIPGASNPVTIPNVTNDPEINNNSAVCGALTIQSGGKLYSTTSGGKLVASSIDLQSGGSMIFSNGEIESTGKMDCDGILTLGGSGVLDVNGEFEVSSSSGGTKSGGSLYVAGDFDASNAEPSDFTGYGSNTVILDGSNHSLILNASASSVIFYNLTSSSSGTVTLQNDNLDINGDLSIAASSTLDVSANNYNITVGGDWTNSGTFVERSGTVTFDGSGSQIVTNNGVGTTKDFNNVTISNTAGSPGDAADVDSDAIKVTGTLTITDGQFQPETSSDFANVTISSSNGILKPVASSALTISGDWNNSGPGTFTHNNGTVTFDGGQSQSVTSGSQSFYNLSTSTSSTALTLQDAMVIANDLTIGANSTLDVKVSVNNALSVGGDWSNSGTFEERSGTVTFNGSGAQTITTGGTGSTKDFNDILINNSATPEDATDVATSGSIKVSGTVTVSDGQFQPATLSDFENITLSASAGIFKVPSSSSITVSGAWNNSGGSSGSFIANSGTVTFDGESAQTITSGNATFYNATISNTSGAVSLGDKFDLNSSGTLTINASAIFALAGYEFDDNAGSITNNGTFQMNGDETLTTGSLSIPGNTKFVDASGATLTTGLSGLVNVEFNSSGRTFTLGESLSYVTGNITIASNTTLDPSANNYGIELDGNWINNGTFTIRSGTVSFSGSDTQTMSGTCSFYNLTVNNSHSSNKVTPSSSVTVSNLLNISDGILAAPASDFDDVTIGANGNLEISGNITVSGDWNDGGSFTPSTNTVTFDGSSAQSITSGGSVFYSVTISNTSSTVSIADKFEFSSGTLTINSSAVFALAGYEFDDNGRTITNNGTFQMNGDETLTTGALSIPGNTIIVDGSGATLTTGLAGLVNVEFNSTGQTFVLGEALSYVSGNLTIASNTTLDVSSSNNYAIFVGGDWSNNGTFTSRSGTVTFSGSDSQAMSGTTSFYNLTINNTHSSNKVTPGSAITVTNVLNVNDGILATPASDYDDVTIGSNGTLELTGNITVSGDWSDAGLLTPSTNTVTFDGSSAQSITSNGSVFHTVTISNTSAAVSIADKFEFASGTLTINSSAIFALAGNEFDDNGATITNNGTFQLNGDETLTTGALTIPGNTKIVDASGATLTTGLAGLVNVEFNSSSGSSQTFVLSENLTYVSGNITIASGTVLDASGSNYNIDLDGNWSNSGTFTQRTGTVTFSGSSAQSISGTNTFYNLTINNSHGSSKVSADGSTLTVQNDLLISDGIFESASDYHDVTINAGTTLELTGNITVSGTWINNGTLTPSTNKVTFDGSSAQTVTTGGTGSGKPFYDVEINNTASHSGNSDDVDCDAIKVTNTLTITDGQIQPADGSDFNNITFASNGELRPDASATITVSGTWTNSASGTFTHNNGTVKYDGGAQGVALETYYNLIVDQSGNKTAQGALNIANDMTISNSATFLTSTNTIDVSGATSVSATLEIGNGQYLSRGGFSATGAINFTHSGGKLRFKSVSPTSLGTLDNSQGTVVYESGATDVLSDDYYTLTIDDGGTAKTLQGAASVAGNLNIKSSNELNLGNNTLSVTGTSDIDGTLDFNSGGIFDANGTFDATNGTVQFTGTGGTLKLGGATVTSLGNTLTEGSGTIEYDYAGNQTVLSETYYNLTINNASGTKSAGGALDIDGDLTVTAGELAMGTNNADVASGKTVNIDGTLSISSGTFTANGPTDIDGTLSITSTGGYDADNTFTAASGNVTFTGAGFLRCSNTVSNLGTLSTDNGTVEYDGGTQDVLADAYYNLEIDQAGTKTAQGTVTVAGTLIVQDNGLVVYDIAGTNTTVTGTTTVNETDGSNYGTIKITTGTYEADGATDIDGKLTIHGSGTYDADNTFDATGATVEFTNTGGTLKLGGATVSSIGNTFTEGSGTVEYDYAGAQSIKTRTYYNLVLDNGTKSTTGNPTISNDLTITDDGTLNSGAGDDNLTIGGDFTIASGGAFIGTAGGSVTTEKITFNGASSAGESCSAIDDANLSIEINKSDASGTLTISGNSNFDAVSVLDGIMDIAATTVTADDAISVQAAGTLKVGSGTFTASSSTSITGKLIINSGTYNADGQLTTSGSPAEIDFTAAGNLVCSSTSANTFGDLDHEAGTVTFDGSSSQAIPAETFFNLKNSNTSGLTMSGDATVNGELNLNVAADITTGTNTLTIGTSGSIANAAADRHINVDNASGYLAKDFGSASAFSFPVGNGTILRPIRLTTSAGSTTYKLRYDDNRYASGAVGASGHFSGGHISGYDGSNSDVTKGYYYDIQRTSGSANASLYVSWTSEDEFGTGGDVYGADLNGIQWGTWTGSQWNVIASTASGNISTGNITTDAAVSDFSNFYFTLGSTDGENNLPIDLLSFDGACIDNQTHLEFVVASQVNNEYFTIERSKNIFEWEVLGFVNGGGTTNEEVTYTFMDVNPKNGENYYRLTQTDIDGTSKSFTPIVVACESRVDDYKIFPNPTNTAATIEFNLEYYQGNNIQLNIKDINGKNRKTIPVELVRGYNRFTIEMEDLPKGFYIIEFIGTRNHLPEKKIVRI